ncbi:hypothetical protein MRX96_011300 [Rhipicephalus microplus]
MPSGYRVSHQSADNVKSYNNPPKRAPERAERTNRDTTAGSSTHYLIKVYTYTPMTLVSTSDDENFVSRTRGPSA